MSSPLARLAAAMDARRLDLGLTWDEVAAEGGIHRETIRSLRNRQTGSVRDLTKRGLEKALRWRTGSVDAVLSGGDPTPLQAEPEHPPAREPDRLDELMQDPEAREALRTIIRRIRGEPPDQPDSAQRDEDAG